MSTEPDNNMEQENKELEQVESLQETTEWLRGEMNKGIQYEIISLESLA